MRAQISRSIHGETDTWNRPAPPRYEQVGESPCRVWSKTSRHVRDDGKEVVVEQIKGMFPKGADVKENDRIVVDDRLSQRLFSGPLSVETVAPVVARGSKVGHLAVSLARHSREEAA